MSDHPGRGQLMKGILLSGGNGTRLYPLTLVTSKQLLPVYDKPMIYYPLSVLMLAGIRDILIISNPENLPEFRKLLGDGERLGLRFSYLGQPRPGGIAESLLIGADFIAGDRVCLILGDNIFYGHGLVDSLEEAAGSEEGATIFAYNVRNPEMYGVVEFDEQKNVVSIEEKPAAPKSRWAATGLYFYDGEAVALARNIIPSMRGELEITELNNAYLRMGRLKANLLGRGFAWLDMGTYESLLDASMFIKTMEERQGLKIGCIEEVAFRMGYIGRAKLKAIATGVNTSYGDYHMKLAVGHE